MAYPKISFINNLFPFQHLLTIQKTAYKSNICVKHFDLASFYT